MTASNNDPSALERVRDIADKGTDVFLLTCFIAAGLVLFIPGIQRRWHYAAAAIVLGFSLGYAARLMDWPDGFMVLGIILGIVTGPVTVAWLHKKTIFEAIEEIQKARRGGSD